MMQKAERHAQICLRIESERIGQGARLQLFHDIAVGE